MCNGCLETILTEYSADFERAFGSNVSAPRIWFGACYGDNEHHKVGDCVNCLQVVMQYSVGRLDILMHRLDGGLHVECSLPFYEAVEIVAQFMPSRVQLAFKRLQTIASIQAN